MNKILRLLVVIFLMITLVGCGTTKTEFKTSADAPKMMTVVDSTLGYTIYRHDITGVHYLSADGGYGKGVCIMVNADGSPYTG